MRAQKYGERRLFASLYNFMLSFSAKNGWRKRYGVRECVRETSTVINPRSLLMSFHGLPFLPTNSQAIAPSMGRLTSLTLDQCPITPSSVKFVLGTCPEITSVVVSTQHGLINHPQVWIDQPSIHRFVFGGVYTCKTDLVLPYRTGQSQPSVLP